MPVISTAEQVKSPTELLRDDAARAEVSCAVSKKIGSERWPKPSLPVRPLPDGAGPTGIGKPLGTLFCCCSKPRLR
jgi:hypothetical protein